MLFRQGPNFQHDEVKFGCRAFCLAGPPVATSLWQGILYLYETSHPELHYEVVRVWHRVLFFDRALGFVLSLKQSNSFFSASMLKLYLAEENIQSPSFQHGAVRGK